MSRSVAAQVPLISSPEASFEMSALDPEQLVCIGVLSAQLEETAFIIECVAHFMQLQ